MRRGGPGAGDEAGAGTGGDIGRLRRRRGVWRVQHLHPPQGGRCPAVTAKDAVARIVAPRFPTPERTVSPDAAHVLSLTRPSPSRRDKSHRHSAIYETPCGGHPDARLQAMQWEGARITQLRAFCLGGAGRVELSALRDIVRVSGCYGRGTWAKPVGRSTRGRSLSVHGRGCDQLATLPVVGR